MARGSVGKGREVFLSSVLCFLREKHLVNQRNSFLESLLGVLDLIITALRVGDCVHGLVSNGTHMLSKELLARNVKREVESYDRKRKREEGVDSKRKKYNVAEEFLATPRRRRKEGLRREGVRSGNYEEDDDEEEDCNVGNLFVALQALLECFLQVCCFLPLEILPLLYF